MGRVTLTLLFTLQRFLSAFISSTICTLPKQQVEINMFKSRGPYPGHISYW